MDISLVLQKCRENKHFIVHINVTVTVIVYQQNLSTFARICIMASLASLLATIACFKGSGMI